MKSNVVCTLVWSRSNSVRRGSADCRVHRPGPTYGGQGSARTARTGLGTRPHPQSWRRTQAGGKKTPEVISRIEELMRHDTAGDPITGVKWSRRTTRKIAEELAALGIAVSKNTVGRLLKDMDFKLRVNRKQIASTKNPDRNQQFLYMGQQREQFASQGLPIISVDTKKKEQIGNFKNTGAKWDREPILVKDHDFRSDADGMAIPYGIYDTQANRGAVFVGTQKKEEKASPRHKNLRKSSTWRIDRVTVAEELAGITSWGTTVWLT